MTEPETVTREEVRDRMANFGIEPAVIRSAREYRDELLNILPEYLFDDPADRSVWAVVYADDLDPADDLTGYEGAVWQDVLELTYKVEMWGLANNRQNFTEVKAVESRMEQADCDDVVLVDPDKTGDIESVFEEIRQDDGVELVE